MALFYTNLSITSNTDNHSNISQSSVFIATNGLIDVPNATNASYINPSIYKNCSDLVIHLVVTCYFIFWAVGFPANVITIIALIKCQRTRNPTTLFIVNLCIIDAILCFFMPPFAIITLIHKDWTLNESACEFYAFIRYTYTSVSLWTIAAIAINRYIMIVHTSCYQMCYKRGSTVFMLITIWLASAASLLPTYIKQWGYFGYSPATGTCTILADSVTGKSSKTFLLVVYLIVPTLTLAVCYPLIYWRVWKSSRVVEKHRPKTTWHESMGSLTRSHTYPSIIPVPRPRIDSGSSDVSTFSLAGTGQTKTSKEMRVLKVTLVIFCAFVACYFPVTLVQIFNGERHHPSLIILGYLVICFSACINPIIYVVMSKEYKNAHKALLCTLCCLKWRARQRDNRSSSTKTSNETTEPL